MESDEQGREINASAAGDAAASLAALFAESAPFKAAPKGPLSSSASSASLSSAGDSLIGDDPGAITAAQNAWRVKFLQKVGAVPDQRAAAPPDVSSSQEVEEASSVQAPAEGSGDTDEVDDIFEEVQQPTPRRSDADIRQAYIKKLEQSRAFIPQLNRPKRSQTVTIYDWDDTLLCTSTRLAISTELTCLRALRGALLEAHLSGLRTLHVDLQIPFHRSP